MSEIRQDMSVISTTLIPIPLSSEHIGNYLHIATKASSYLTGEGTQVFAS
jgi:hypothetical protein